MDFFSNIDRNLILFGPFDLPWWGYIIALLVLTHITIASVTIFLHRHQAHRALDLHPIPSHFFRMWLWMTTGMVTKEWAAIHRKHHAKCETAEDPHSPQQLGINRVLWGGVFLYVKESRNKETLEKYGHGTPDDWMEHKVYGRYMRLGLWIMAFINFAAWGLLPGVIITLVQIAWIPFWAAGVINGIGHFWGYRNYDCPDASTNILPWGIWIGGEELHNNHHTFATSAKLSNKWYEFDIGWMYIRILEILGLATVKKVAPTPKFAEVKPVCDFDTLQAVIANRYDVTSKYAKTLKATCATEFEQLKSHLPHRESMRLRHVRKVMLRDESKLQEKERSHLNEVLDSSSKLQTVYRMRTELAALWERSSASREQLLKDLQDWCVRAEQSGIRPLQEFALRLRSYA